MQILYNFHSYTLNPNGSGYMGIFQDKGLGFYSETGRNRFIILETWTTDFISKIINIYPFPLCTLRIESQIRCYKCIENVFGFVYDGRPWSIEIYLENPETNSYYRIMCEFYESSEDKDRYYLSTLCEKIDQHNYDTYRRVRSSLSYEKFAKTHDIHGYYIGMKII